jgi:hypothetical protein
LHCREWDKLTAVILEYLPAEIKTGAETEFEVNYNVLSGSVLMIID